MGSGRFSERAANGLALAAAPTFALMAMLTALAGDGHPDSLPAPEGSGWPVSGMVPMYLLMALFHLPHWFRRMSGRPAS